MYFVQICITDAGPKVFALGTATSNGFKSFDSARRISLQLNQTFLLADASLLPLQQSAALGCSPCCFKSSPSRKTMVALPLCESASSTGSPSRCLFGAD